MSDYADVPDENDEKDLDLDGKAPSSEYEDNIVGDPPFWWGTPDDYNWTTAPCEI